MANVFYNIQKALDQRLNSLSGLPDVAWMNVEYEPTRGTEYLRPTLLPAESTKEEFGGKDRHIGIYQIDIFEPLDNGPKDALEMADDIREHFDDQILTESSQKIYIENISLLPPQRVESWYVLSVEINYLSIAE
jgi:hypothetical protein